FFIARASDEAVPHHRSMVQLPLARCIPIAKAVALPQQCTVDRADVAPEHDVVHGYLVDERSQFHLEPQAVDAMPLAIGREAGNIDATLSIELLRLGCPVRLASVCRLFLGPVHQQDACARMHVHLVPGLAQWLQSAPAAHEYFALDQLGLDGDAITNV